MNEIQTQPANPAALARRAVAVGPAGGANGAGQTVRAVCERTRAGPRSVTKFVAGISGVMAVFVFLAGLADPLPIAPALFATFALFAALPALVITRARWQAGGELIADRTGLVVRRGGQGRCIEAGQIEDGFEANGRLGLHLRGGAMIEAALEPDAARAVLAALGLTLDHRAQTAPLRGVLGGFTRGFLLGLLAWAVTGIAAGVLGAAAPAQLLAPLVGLGTGFLVARRYRPRLVVGTDGLRVLGTWRPRFIPYRDILEVRHQPRPMGQDLHPYLILGTTKGDLPLPVIGQSPEQIASLISRIEEARAAYLGRDARDIALLDRGDRSIAAWSRELGEAIAGGGGFRDAALSRVDLTRVLADPRARLERRVGAALALATDPAGREQVRLAAEQAADPAARGALAAVTEATQGGGLDEARIEAALRGTS